MITRDLWQPVAICSGWNGGFLQADSLRWSIGDSRLATYAWRRDEKRGRSCWRVRWISGARPTPSSWHFDVFNHSGISRYGILLTIFCPIANLRLCLDRFHSQRTIGRAAQTHEKSSIWRPKGPDHGCTKINVLKIIADCERDWSCRSIGQPSGWFISRDASIWETPD